MRDRYTKLESGVDRKNRLKLWMDLEALKGRGWVKTENA